MLSAIATPLLALAVLASTPQPYSLTISPVKSAAEVGHVSLVHVYDTGTSPLDLSVSEREVKRNSQGQCAYSPTVVPYVTLNKTRFHLRPKGEVTVRVHVTKGATPGKHTLATVVATPVGQRGNVHVSGAAASLMLLSVPGHVAHAQRPCVTLPPATASSPPWALLAAVGLIAFALACTLWRLVRKHSARLGPGRHHA